MTEELIFIPLLLQVLLTAIVWVWMYVTRIRYVIINGIDPQDLSDNTRAQAILKDVSAPSENVVNLFEVPVLFYTLIIVIYVTNLVSAEYFGFALAFVVLRTAHSFIHITYNRVVHRFAVYFVSTVVLWGMWLSVAVELVARMRGS